MKMETVLSLDEQQSDPSVEKSDPSVERPEQNEKQHKPEPEESQDPKKGSGQWNAAEMLSQHFKQPVRFVTYTGLKDLDVTRIKMYTVWGKTAKGQRLKMAKLQVLFAFPKENMPDLKPHIKVRAPLKAENLQPIEAVAERYSVDDELLEQARDNKSNVTIVTRAGYVLNGWIQQFDKYVLYMRIGEKMVIVYRHGLYNLTVDEQPEDAS